MTIKATTENVTSLVATKLTGAMPALDASAVTGISVGPQSGASDPTVSTNPSGVGIVYENTTSGKVFICTSATAGANVWKNVGSGEIGIGKCFGGQGGGTVAGFTSSGEPQGSQGAIINRYTFASANDATNHGTLSLARGAGKGCSSSTHGVTAGGYNAGYRNTIDKWAFASNTTAADHGDLTNGLQSASSNSSSPHGYISGGYPNIKRIDKFPFATNSGATSAGDLIENIYHGAGSDSHTHGYVLGGGGTSSGNVSYIQKFSFATDGSSNNHGNLTIAAVSQGGTSSNTHGYSAGGHGATNRTNVINKFSFSTAGTATDHGDLTVGRRTPSESSSLTHGFTAGGYSSADGSTRENVIDKFAFASNVTATDVGNLTAIRAEFAGHQD